MNELYKAIPDIVQYGGIGALSCMILILGFLSLKDNKKSREQTNKILEQYKQDLSDFHEINKRYTELLCAMKDIISQNSAMMERLSIAINSNQYCPLARVRPTYD